MHARSDLPHDLPPPPLVYSSSVLSGGASPHDVCRRAATFSSHFGMTHCGGKWGLKERSRGLHVRVRTGMARESRHSWLESPFTTFLSLSLFILDHSHNAESYAGNVDSDMPPTRGSDALFFGNLDDPHCSRSLNHSLTSPDTKSAKLSPSPFSLSHSHLTALLSACGPTPSPPQYGHRLWMSPNENAMDDEAAPSTQSSMSSGFSGRASVGWSVGGFGRRGRVSE